MGVSLFFILTSNYAFFKNTMEFYPLSLDNIGFLSSLTLTLFAVFVLFFSLVSSRYIIKPIVAFVLVCASFANYFMNNYNIVIDDTMLQNILETNIGESLDLLSLKLVINVLFMGLLPAFFVLNLNLEKTTFAQALFSRLKMLTLILVVASIGIFTCSKFYTSFLREHKPLRYYTNPSYFIYSSIKYTTKQFFSTQRAFKTIGNDAKKIPSETRKLVVVVVGEAVRWDKLSFNGYQRQTTPLLEKESLINFSNMYSCGTSTAISVPCMFSILEKNNYSDIEAKNTENVLDIVKKTGANVLWRDNNSDSKGVAERVEYEDFKTSKNNPICDEECRDEGMLEGLQNYIDKHKQGDILIVLHQMGNHGPAYYRRYPKEFERFTPTCKSNELAQCTNEEITNAYDNVILYTDYFLSKTIGLLKQNDGAFEATLLYVSDHGESLGEKGLYLHGLPYFVAPEAQKHVGAFAWFSQKTQSRLDMDTFKDKANQPYSHDNLFHTILGLMEIETTVYEPQKDIIRQFRK